MKILTFDLEIERPCDGTPEGWAAARKGELGVSVVAVWDSEFGRPFLYGPQDLQRCVNHLNSADKLVGFNSSEFDAPILESLSGVELEADHYDILAHVWSALGTRKKGWKLNDIAQRTIGVGKDGRGAAAPILYAQGRYMELASYCIGDVWLTRELYNHIVDVGHILGPQGEELHLEQPIEGEYA